MIIALTGLLVRRIFMQELSPEFLGYDGLFGNVFTLFSMSDLGISALISYRLYALFAEENYNKIGELIGAYGQIYKLVCIIIIVLSLLFLPFVKVVVTGNNISWNYIYCIYVLQVINTISTYLWGYRRILYEADQKNYICIRIDTLAGFCRDILRIITLIVLKNYIIYLVIGIAVNVCGNIVLYFKARKDYLRETIQKPDIRSVFDAKFIREIKDNLIQRISQTIYSSTDNILISIFCGITTVGIASNYSMICSYVTSLIMKTTQPLQAAIGNYVYSEDRNAGQKLFHMFNVFGFFMGTIVACEYFLLFNPVITLWLGKEFLLPTGYVLAFSLNQFIAWNQYFISLFRNAFGNYDYDRKYSLYGAIFNIVCSVVFVKWWNVAGIMIGTCIGHMAFWIGRANFMYTYYINSEKKVTYWTRQSIHVFIFGIEILILSLISPIIGFSVPACIVRGLLGIIVPFLTGQIIYFRNPIYRDLLGFIYSTLTDFIGKK